MLALRNGPCRSSVIVLLDLYYAIMHHNLETVLSEMLHKLEIQWASDVNCKNRE